MVRPMRRGWVGLSLASLASPLHHPYRRCSGRSPSMQPSARRMIRDLPHSSGDRLVRSAVCPLPPETGGTPATDTLSRRFIGDRTREASRPAPPSAPDPPRSRLAARRRCGSSGCPSITDPVGALEVGQHEDVEQLGAGAGPRASRRARIRRSRLVGPHRSNGHLGPSPQAGSGACR